MYKLEKAGKIKGWQSLEEMVWLAEHARDCNMILEVGTYYGRSARVMLDNSNAVLYCVDPWNNPILDKFDKPIGNVNEYVYQEFLKNMDGMYTSGRCRPYKGVLRHFTLASNFDMIFIDGDHRYNWVKEDIQLAKQLCRKDGIICGHDYNWKDVNRAVNEDFGDKVKTLDSIWWVVNE